MTHYNLTVVEFKKQKELNHNDLYFLIISLSYDVNK